MDYKKPGYDGRLHYVQTLNTIIVNIHEASVEESHHRWCNLLFTALNQVAGFVDTTKHTKLYDDLKRIYGKIHLYNSPNIRNKINLSLNINNLNIKLHEITKDYIFMSRHLLLPVSDDDEQEFDWDKYAKESDL